MKQNELESGYISPTTMTGYRSYQRNLIDDIKDIPVLKINERVLNRWIDDLHKEHSAKTCKNAYSFIRSSLTEVLPRSTVLDWHIKLPREGAKKVNVPIEENIRIA